MAATAPRRQSLATAWGASYPTRRPPLALRVGSAAADGPAGRGRPGGLDGELPLGRRAADRRHAVGVVARLLAALDGPWGRPPAAPAPVRVGEWTDARLDGLAAWADWHRTAVRVAYRGAHFRLLPDLCARAHGGAKAGRAVFVEVGDDGGRLWHAPGAAKGGRAYNEFFEDECEDME
eukprot:TRINITY_DN20019_c0_g2_i1.p5 TRINITY_DN20019_c0_g2~~TRINITY_DN20019_c0_g2_i1.p5  ORF type:complete len:178 (+),score=39.59 TRINITY_DN20019_c0_g2_i1:641-1174(+)